MKPPVFKYCAARSVDEAVHVLTEHGDDVTILAGGQSLVPMLNMRMARPEVVLDINHVGEIAGVHANGRLSIGALTRQRVVEHSDVVAHHAPLLRDGVRHIGHPAIRARGTIGGSAAHADPASEIPAVLVALDASIILTGPNGDREVRAADFFVSVFTTAREPDEVLTRIDVPPASPTSRSAFLEVSRRHGDYALVGVGAQIDEDGDGRITSARIAITNVADVPFRARQAEDFLIGQQLGDPAVRLAAADAAAAALSPSGDQHASTEYRIDVSRTLVRRVLERIHGGAQ
ncbi:xanthine dehydrogenase family protein subunit M [Pseudonocardia xishanensis]|uniref:Xanthine dehydrogenase family protein subunit M n=1 Tax=Pseudonocardia xishanensis TaxID=630995 RepID=A0ABP8RVA3_9PSEU